MKMRIACAVFLLCLTSCVSATDYYVDVNHGDDWGNNGRSPDDAWKSITFALERGVSGSQDYPAVLHIASGMYAPPLESFPLKPRSYVSLVGSDPTEVVIDAEGTSAVFNLVFAERVVFSGLTITGGDGYFGGGIYMHMCDGCRIDNCVIRGNRSSFGGGLSIDWAVTMQGVYEEFLELTDCIISDNYGTQNGGGVYILSGGKVTARRCLIWSNVSPVGAGIAVGWGSLELVDCVIADNIAEIGDYQKRSLGAGVLVNFSASRRLSFEAVNCLFNSNQNLDGPVGALYISLPEEGVARLSGCTFSNNTARDWGPALCVNVREDYSVPAVEVTDCIFRDGGDEIWEEDPGLVVVENSCVEGGWDGEGASNFDADPLFVSGPLGDYYLSQTAAGQAEESPCVDVGSDTAEALGLDALTTRTDCGPDAGVVDIGYHYPLGANEVPTIECSLNADQFSTGDQLVGSYEIANPGPDITVDVYFAFVMPDGAILCISPSRIGFGIFPCMTDVVLEQGYSVAPETLVDLMVPGGLPTGGYLFAGALSTPGVFEVIGDLSLFAFSMS